MNVHRITAKVFGKYLTPEEGNKESAADIAPAVQGSAIAPHAWYAIFILFIVNVVNYVDRMALAVLLPWIKIDLALSDTQLGLLVGFAFSLFYAVCGIPIARLADRAVRKSIIAIALATWSVMTALSGAAQSFGQLFMARVGVGVGEAGCLPPSQSMICDYVPAKRRPGIYAIHTFGLLVGMMLGMASAAWIAAAIGWRWTFVVLGLPGLLLAGIVQLTVREPIRGHFDKHQTRTEPLSFKHTIITLAGSKTYRLLLTCLAVNGFANFGLFQWWPSLYARVFHLEPATVGVYLGIAVGLGSGAGLLIGGYLANRLVLQDVKRPLLMGAVAFLLALPTALGSVFSSSALSSIALVALTTLLWSVAHGPIVATLYGGVAPNMRATAGAISLFLTAILGQGLGPLCVGFLSDQLTPALGSDALRYALLGPICALPIMAATLYAAAKEISSARLRSADVLACQSNVSV
jgi:predicted MFS family arabinose efflux permease